MTGSEDAGGGAKPQQLRGGREKPDGGGGRKRRPATPSGRASLASSLLLKVGEFVGEEEEKELEEELKRKVNWTNFLYDGFALVAMGASAAAMIIEGSQIVNVVGIVCTLLGPSAAIQQHKISQLEGMRETQNKLREQVNELHRENGRLARNIDRLEKSEGTLKDIEKKLVHVSREHGKTVDVMVQTLNEYKVMQAEIKENLEARVIQRLISTILTSDRNRDFTIDPDECDVLMLNLKCIDGVRFHEEAFRRAISETERRSVTGILNLVKNLIDDSVPDRENIFEIDIDGLFSKRKTK